METDQYSPIMINQYRQVQSTFKHQTNCTMIRGNLSVENNLNFVHMTIRCQNMAVPAWSPKVHDTIMCWSNCHEQHTQSSIRMRWTAHQCWKALSTAEESTYDVVYKDMLGMHDAEDDVTAMLQDVR
jgi:hypothetical protein